MASAGLPMKNPKAYLTKGQWMAMLRACTRYRDRLLIYTLALTGRRVSEIVRELKPRDINWEEGLVNFTLLKRRIPTKRLLPVHPKLLRLLRLYVRRHRIKDDQPIFTICRSRIFQVMKEAARKAGVIGAAYPHALRHGFAIRAAKKARSPADIVRVQQLLGHARIDTTMFYLRFNPVEERNLVKEMWEETPPPRKDGRTATLPG